MVRLADGVDVGEVHELDLTLRVVLWALAPSTSGPVGDGRGIGPGVDDQDFLRRRNKIVRKWAKDIRLQVHSWLTDATKIKT